MFSIIRTVKEYKELKYLAYHDSLTGLLNRNWLYKNIGNIDKKYIFFIDINNLHEINKKGHTFGDEYIKEAINSILLVKEDILIRYAGDEFILFTNRKQAIYNCEYFTIGFAEIGDDITLSITKADENMLKNKENAKNIKK
jgi:GGDEF domain-containing protein